MAWRKRLVLLAPMDKASLLGAIIDKLKKELATQTSAALTSREEATHEESKPENKYDMHAQEAAYLAEGQARLAAELNESIALYHGLSADRWPTDQAAGVGAVVRLEFKNKPSLYFIGPRNGGMEIEVGDEVITVVTAHSPLGRQLVGATVGEMIKMPSRGGPVLHRVVAVE